MQRIHDFFFALALLSLRNPSMLTPAISPMDSLAGFLLPMFFLKLSFYD